jgi:DNA-binding NarL/FixJ family response regulator
MTSISVLAVDDDQVFADALQARLATEVDLGPVAAAYSAGEALGRLGRAPVDVAIVDYMLGDETGAVLARRMAEAAPRTRVVMVSASQSVDAVVDALVAGARAWLPKTIDTDHLVRVIRGVHAGEMWVDPPLLGAAMPVLLTRLLTPEPDPLNVLTARERQVLDCMVQGLSRAEIAARLKLSGNTVRTHTQNLIGKLGVHTSLEAVTLALRNGHQATSSPAR